MNGPPKILVLTTTFPRWARDAGPASFVFDLCRHLCDEFAITVIAPHHPGAAYAEQVAGLRVWRFPYFWPESREFLADGRGLLPNARSSWLGKAQAGTLVLAQQRFLRRALAAERFAVIHSHWLVPSALNAALADAVAPKIVTAHSTDVHLLRQLPGGRRIARYLLRRTRRVIAVSSFLQRVLTEVAGEPVESRVLPMGVDLARFASAAAKEPPPPALAGKRVALYVGKMIEVKGVEHLIRAFAAVRAEIPDAALALVGDGERRPALEAEARRLGLDDAVHFFGAQPHAEIHRWYGWAELVAFPSIVTPRGETEGMPVVLLEAMAAGRPVVASRIGSLDELVLDGQTGRLVPPQDPPALAAAMVATLRDPARAAMGAAGAAAATRFGWPRIAAAYAEEWRALLDDGPRASLFSARAPRN